MDKKSLGWLLGVVVAGLVLPGCCGTRCWNSWWGKNDCCTECASHPEAETTASAHKHKPQLDDLSAEAPVKRSERKALKEPVPSSAKAKSPKGWEERTARSADDESSAEPTRPIRRASTTPSPYQGSAGRWNNKQVGEEPEGRRIRASLPPVVSGKKTLAADTTTESEESEEASAPEAVSSSKGSLKGLPTAPSIPPLPPSLDD